MYLRRLEIFGFKSFAERTALDFEPGITAVVGPNGCGKSNVFDSIRWVLGEQSVKELRGSSMEDVIFNGTDKRPALGFAEVSLTFSNESKILPVEYEEITVTRRLYRSGESEYLLNKTQVRLKDILELFMGTGVGAEAYSLVQQGKVDLVVSAKPEERRFILDEAAGITKYKSKKKEALGKLKDTEDNLLRLNDIVVEVKRQIASLERQADKARKYKEEFESLKKQELLWATFQLKELVQSKQSLLSQAAETETQLAGHNEEKERLASMVDDEKFQLQDLERQLNDIRAEQIKLENRIEMQERQISFNEERMASLNASQERLEERKAQLKEYCRQQQMKCDALRQDLAVVEENFRNSSQALSDQRDSLQHLVQRIKDDQQAIQLQEQNILELTAAQVHLRNEITEVAKDVQGALARKRRLDVEYLKVTSEKDQNDNRLQGVSAEVQQCLNVIESLQSEESRLQEVLHALKVQKEGLVQAMEELDKRKLLLKSQKIFIGELTVLYDDMPDPIVQGTLLATALPQEGRGIIGKVKGATPVPLDKRESLEQQFPQFRGGDVFEVQCETKFIELDPQAMDAKIEEVAQKWQEQNLRKEALEAQWEQREGEVKILQGRLLDQEKTLSKYEVQRHSISEEVTKLAGELALLASEMTETQEHLAVAQQKETKLNENLEEVNGQFQAKQQEIKEKQQEIAVLSQQKEAANLAIVQGEADCQSSREKKKSVEENIQMISETLMNRQQEIHDIDEEALENQGRGQKFQEEVGQLKSGIEALQQERDILEGSLSENMAKKESQMRRVEEIQLRLNSLEKILEQLNSQLHEQKMRAQEFDFKEQTIKNRLEQVYQINPGEVEFPPEAAPWPGEDVLIEIERLKKRCESFGSVNLVAIEEFNALRERFEFLTKQQSDLLTARESLHQTIQKINRTTRQMFLDTFTKVSEEFRIYFRMLFGGGDAQLVLVDPENVLESGIEIVARPPGKKLQSISLLSGGEKSLTAIALIFGVFKVRPSPFCILDEIDAALDESNVGRYGYLLKEFSQIAQFIVITHNKKTIANANVMYGITMQETGVSTVVSVKLDERQSDVSRQEEPLGVG